MASWRKGKEGGREGGRVEWAKGRRNLLGGMEGGMGGVGTAEISRRQRDRGEGVHKRERGEGGREGGEGGEDGREDVPHSV
jgi:hypothetical protein